ncbi:MAG: hypothetical protein WC608_00295 [Parcubacteria group bacterium]
MNPITLLSSLGVPTNLTQDIMLLLFVALASFVYGTLIGRWRLMAALINIYVSFALITVIPADLIADYNMKLLIFFILLISLTVLSKRFFDISFSGSGANYMLRVFAMSFLEIALVLSIVFSIVPKKAALGYVSANAYGYLVAGYAPLVWMVLPLAYMFFMYRKMRR